VFSPKTYPYPVLAPFLDDYLKPFSFDPKILVSEHDDGFKLSMGNFDHGQLPHTLRAALADGDAILVMNVECSATLYRRVSPVVNDVVHVPGGVVLGEIAVTPLILATRTLKFMPVVGDEIDDFFGVADAFELSAGDPLAISDTHFLTASHSLNESNSIIKLVSDSSLAKGLFTIGTDSNAIEILVNPAAYNAFVNLYKSHDNRPTFILGVIKDALLFAINTLALQDESEDEYLWCRPIRDRLSDLGVDDIPKNDLSKMHELAQRLVKTQGIDLLVGENE
jgi:hypothetical protein